MSGMRKRGINVTFSKISMERAVVTLARYRVQLVEQDPDHLNGLRLLLDGGKALQIIPRHNRLHFGLASVQECATND